MTDTIEQQVREGLARLRDGAPAQAFDPAEDLARGHAARRRARSRALATVAASMTAVAVAAAVWVHGPSGTATLSPAASPTSDTSVRPRTPSPGPSTPAGTRVSLSPTTAAPLTTGQLGLRMVAAVRAHAADAERYLGGWGDGSSGGGIHVSRDAAGVGRFGITVSWGRPGSSSLGGLEIGTTTASFARQEGEADSLRCGGAFTDTAPSVCILQRREPDGSRLYYGSTGATRGASYARADGRVTYVAARSQQPGNSLTSTTAPLPSESELIAIVTDPRLLWDGTLVDSSPYDSGVRGGWPTRPTGTAP